MTCDIQGRKEILADTDQSNQIRIIITGDFCLHKRIEELCLAEKYEKIYNDVLPMLKDKDISITNLECPLTTDGDPIKKVGPHLIAHPDCMGAIKYGGFDIVTLANNHILDYGKNGLKNTLQILEEAGIHTVGAGENLDGASKPLYIKIKNRKIAILNFAEHEFSIAGEDQPGVNPLDIVVNYYQIRKAKKNADIVLVIIHGGIEHYHLPSPRMVMVYRFFADLGVSAILGHHSHCFSGYEIYNGVPIFYGLGNFVFDWKNMDDAWYEGCCIQLTITNDNVSALAFFPYYQCRNEPGLFLMDEEEKLKFLRKIKDSPRIIQNASLLKEHWIKFCDSKKADYLSGLLTLNKIQRQMLKGDILTNLILKEKKLLRLLNLLKCEAHRDVMIEIIENTVLQKD
jgi:poly-gamma-glutamate synthesis protein (capsule biosynthesis protein)